MTPIEILIALWSYVTSFSLLVRRSPSLAFAFKYYKAAAVPIATEEQPDGRLELELTDFTHDVPRWLEMTTLKGVGRLVYRAGPRETTSIFETHSDTTHDNAENPIVPPSPEPHICLDFDLVVCQDSTDEWYSDRPTQTTKIIASTLGSSLSTVDEKDVAGGITATLVVLTHYEEGGEDDVAKLSIFDHFVFFEIGLEAPLPLARHCGSLETLGGGRRGFIAFKPIDWETSFVRLMKWNGETHLRTQVLRRDLTLLSAHVSADLKRVPSAEERNKNWIEDIGYPDHRRSRVQSEVRGSEGAEEAEGNKRSNREKQNGVAANLVDLDLVNEHVEVPPMIVYAPVLSRELRVANCSSTTSVLRRCPKSTHHMHHIPVTLFLLLGRCRAEKCHSLEREEGGLGVQGAKIRLFEGFGQMSSVKEVGGQGDIERGQERCGCCTKRMRPTPEG
ncbi:hypothetical protein BKA70DRAFT_1230981 [Coprinopsis sp. MPI-PUGE-AT-0042]|nr:hypothetical protein BKA70DRAFT_1230981 [Coprinopsis sp. MPI-PUGE-AT-0042]